MASTESPPKYNLHSSYYL